MAPTLSIADARKAFATLHNDARHASSEIALLKVLYRLSKLQRDVSNNSPPGDAQEILLERISDVESQTTVALERIFAQAEAAQESEESENDSSAPAGGAIGKRKRVVTARARQEGGVKIEAQGTIKSKMPTNVVQGEGSSVPTGRGKGRQVSKKGKAVIDMENEIDDESEEEVVKNVSKKAHAKGINDDNDDDIGAATTMERRKRARRPTTGFTYYVDSHRCDKCIKTGTKMCRVPPGWACDNCHVLKTKCSRADASVRMNDSARTGKIRASAGATRSAPPPPINTSGNKGNAARKGQPEASISALQINVHNSSRKRKTSPIALGPNLIQTPTTKGQPCAGPSNTAHIDDPASHERGPAGPSITVDSPITAPTVQSSTAPPRHSADTAVTGVPPRKKRKRTVAAVNEDFSIFLPQHLGGVALALESLEKGLEAMNVEMARLAYTLPGATP